MAEDPPPSYANDDFDDVFGSEPSSPSLLPTQHPIKGNLEPSDIPRLREKHETEGYRDGVTKGKGESVQAGFDEGYGLGTVLGLKIGKILGLLEGILAGLKGEELGVQDERRRLMGLVRSAGDELSTQRVFGRDYWGEDGIWKFEVGKEANEEVVFPDVAAAHPLVRKWEEIVEDEVRKWGLDLGIFDREVEGEGELEDIGFVKGAQGREAGNREVESEPVAAGMAKVLGISKKDLTW